MKCPYCSYEEFEKKNGKFGEYYKCLNLACQKNISKRIMVKYNENEMEY